MNNKYQTGQTQQSICTIMLTGLLAATALPPNSGKQNQSSLLELTGSANYISTFRGTSPTYDSHKSFLTGRYVSSGLENELNASHSSMVLNAFYESLTEFHSLYTELAK